MKRKVRGKVSKGDSLKFTIHLPAPKLLSKLFSRLNVNTSPFLPNSVSERIRFINVLSWQKILIPLLIINVLIFFLLYSITNSFIYNQTNIPPINSVLSTTEIFFLLVSNFTREPIKDLLTIKEIYSIMLLVCSLIFVFLFLLKTLLIKRAPLIKRILLINASFYLILASVVISSSSILLVILQTDQKAQEEVKSLEVKVTIKEKEEIDGVVFDYKSISERILKERKSPQLILSRDLIAQKLLFTLLGEKKNNFYYAVLIRNNIFKETRSDSSFSKAISKVETVLFPDFALFVNTKDFEKLTDLGYSIGNVIVTNKYEKLSNNKLLDMNFSLLTQEEYVKEIKRKQDKLKETFENQIAIEKSNIQQIQIYMDQISIDIADLDRRYSNAVNDAFSFYSICMKSVVGYYNPGLCSSKKNELDATNRKILEYKNELEDKLQDARNLLKYRLSILNSWNIAYKEFLSNPRDPYGELGSFNPPNDVFVTILSKENGQFDQYILTVVHEFLHYSSHRKGYYFDNKFFEEATTEYLSRELVSNAFKNDVYSGSYELAVQIFKELLKRLPEEGLENLYFKKDEDGVVALIDKEYGKGTYSKISNDLVLLLYTSPSHEKARELKEKVLSNLK